MRTKTTKPQKQIKFRFFSKCNSSLRLTILSCQINTDFDSILDPLHLKLFLLFIYNHLFNKLTILMIKNSCSFNVNNQGWFFNDSLIETKVTANWSKKILLYTHFIVLTVLSVWFFGYKMTNQLPICKKNKRKNVFWNDNLSARGWKNPPQCCTFLLDQVGCVGGWVLLKLFFHFKWRWRCKKNKNTEFVFRIIVFQKSGLPN